MFGSGHGSWGRMRQASEQRSDERSESRSHPGGFGSLRDAAAERHYRDSRILGIGGGTTEIMNEIVADRLGLR